MLKRLREIDWLAINTAALVLVFGLWSASKLPSHEQEIQNPAKADTDQAGNQNYPWWQYSGAWIAIFTIVLTGSTIALWRVTRVAADAAKAAVDALPIVERGYLYPVIVNSESIKNLFKAAETYWPGDVEKRSIRLLTTPEVEFKIINYGKTPGILKRVNAGVYLTSGRKVELPLALTDGVLGEKEPTSPIGVDMILGLTPNQAGDVSLGKDHLWFSGHILYIDIWGNECVTDFIFDWHYMGQCFVHRHVNTTTNS